uniref:Uncharacterized protein n=1 Tax=Romanomermis culicivorax TaxID=13658 RepID=A0A915JU42_ROMCU
MENENPQYENIPYDCPEQGCVKSFLKHAQCLAFNDGDDDHICKLYNYTNMLISIKMKEYDALDVGRPIYLLSRNENNFHPIPRSG